MTFAAHVGMADGHHAFGSPISGRWLSLAMVISTAVVAVMMLANRLVVNPDNWGLWAALVPCAALGVLRQKTRLGTTASQVRLRDFSEHGITLIVICLLGAVASYEAACDTSGFADAALAKSDRMLHFNWLTWYGVVVRHAALQRLGAGVYSTIWVTPWLLVTYLAWTGQRATARRFLFTFWVSIVLTLALFPLFPAKGALDYLWHGPIPYMPTNGLYQGAIIPALRAHAMTRIDIGSLKGLVCAPSFHTVSAVVFIASVWPHRVLRRFLVPLNLAMLLATPVEGTHYLSDMILGFGVALAAIGLVQMGGNMLARPRGMTGPAY